MFSMLIPFITIPITTRVLSLDEYGVLKNLQSPVLIFNIIFGFYISSAYTRFFYDYKNNKNNLATLTSSCFFFLLIFGAVFILPAIFSGYYFLKLISIEPLKYLLVTGFLIPFSVWFNSLSSISIAFLRQEKRNTILK